MYLFALMVASGCNGSGEKVSMSSGGSTGGVEESPSGGSASQVGGGLGGGRRVNATTTSGGDIATQGTLGGKAGTVGTLGGAGNLSNATEGASSSGGTQGGTASTSPSTTDARCDEFVMPPDCSIPEGAVLPAELRCTGLYTDWSTRALRCGVRGYTPAHQLWADGAEKQRYVWLPQNGTVDVTHPEAFVFPIGTRFWKEFYVGPAGHLRLGETRYLLKVKGGWLYTAYLWSEDGSTAVQNNAGVEDLFGTGHSVPTREQCKTCHSGRTDYVLGWDFIMLGKGATGITASDLSKSGQLSGLDPNQLDPVVPGDDIERVALGYLHANCGISCHNQSSNATAKPSGLHLRLEFGEMQSVLSTDAATSGINRLPSPNADYRDVTAAGGDFYDFRPLDVGRSLAWARMDYRGSLTAMPPIGTHVIDPEGLSAVKAWVESMTVARGYPPPAP